MVGLEVVLLQQIPREVIVAPPSLETEPPPEAVVCVVDVMELVVTPVGIVAGNVENDITEP